MKIALSALFVSSLLAAQPLQLEKLERKTILLFTPHPDDDTFCCAGTLALLAKRQNNIHIVIYTNDDKGSYDPGMTSERLAAIRKNPKLADMQLVRKSRLSVAPVTAAEFAEVLAAGRTKLPE
jgi:hypothetical protein